MHGFVHTLSTEIYVFYITIGLCVILNTHSYYMSNPHATNYPQCDIIRHLLETNTRYQEFHDTTNTC
jgi:hypothetical protein